MSEQRVSQEEMEQYLMFPDIYCKGCEGGCGPLCVNCLNDLVEFSAVEEIRHGSTH